MQSQMMALLLTANGHKVITETVLKIDLCMLQNLRMNANISVEGRSAKIEGKAIYKVLKLKPRI